VKKKTRQKILRKFKLGGTFHVSQTASTHQSPWAFSTFQLWALEPQSPKYHHVGSKSQCGFLDSPQLVDHMGGSLLNPNGLTFRLNDKGDHHTFKMMLASWGTPPANQALKPRG
jgi:hypothetical protein